MDNNQNRKPVSERRLEYIKQQLSSEFDIAKDIDYEAMYAVVLKARELGFGAFSYQLQVDMRELAYDNGEMSSYNAVITAYKYTELETEGAAA